MRTKSENIEQGSIIHKETPFVYVLSSKVLTKYCDYCFSSGKLLKCSNCRFVYYCGRNCQKEGWNIHRYECQSLRKVAPRVVPDGARLLARLIRRMQNGGDQIKVYYTEGKFRMFKDLMSHYSDIKIDQTRIEHFMSLCQVLQDYIGKDSLPNSAELMGYYGRFIVRADKMFDCKKMCINSFNVFNQELQSIGTAIYLGASVIDHSCKPNTLAMFEGVTLYVRALETIINFDWSKVFISYIDVLNTSKDRREELLAAYYFLCQCPSCLSPPPLGITSGASCQDNTCDGYIDMSNNEKKCSKCNAQVADMFQTEYEDVTEFSELHLTNMKQFAYLDVCKVCLKKQKGVLYKYNVQYVKTLDLAFESSIDLGQWDDAEKFGIQLIDGYRFYYGDIHPLLGLLFLKLGKILLLREQFSQAVAYLNKSQQILKITHGINSSLVKKELVPLLRQAQVDQMDNSNFE